MNNLSAINKGIDTLTKDKTKAIEYTCHVVLRNSFFQGGEKIGQNKNSNTRQFLINR